MIKSSFDMNTILGITLAHKTYASHIDLYAVMREGGSTLGTGLTFPEGAEPSRLMSRSPVKPVFDP